MRKPCAAIAGGVLAQRGQFFCELTGGRRKFELGGVASPGKVIMPDALRSVKLGHDGPAVIDPERVDDGPETPAPDAFDNVHVVERLAMPV